MGRILAIDYGSKRCGLAVSDPARIIAGALTTVATNELQDYITHYITVENVDQLVIGKPTKVNGEASETMQLIEPFIKRMKKAFPQLPIELVDERFTTKLAFQTMLDAGLSRKARNNKNGTVDRVSATIILQTYMESIR